MHGCAGISTSTPRPVQTDYCFSHTRRVWRQPIRAHIPSSDCTGESSILVLLCFGECCSRQSRQKRKHRNSNLGPNNREVHSAGFPTFLAQEYFISSVPVSETSSTNLCRAKELTDSFSGHSFLSHKSQIRAKALMERVVKTVVHSDIPANDAEQLSKFYKDADA